MPRWYGPGEVLAVLAFAVALVLVFSQVFRAAPNIVIFATGVLLAVVAMIGFSDANARPGR